MTLAATRSSVSFLATVTAMHAAAWFEVRAARMQAFLTYCWAMSEPPWVPEPESVVVSARIVPRRSSAPC